MSLVDTYPIPSEALRWRVVGNRDAAAFLRSGVRTTAFFDGLLAKAGRSLAMVDSIFDFGCGCGRILRALPARTEARLVGCDIDAEAISWCRENLPFAGFHRSGEHPPLPFENHAFDFIYGISVFTHLDEAHQFKWMEELARVAQPGGLLVLTYRGEDNVEKLENPTQRKKVEYALKESGFYTEKTRFWKGVFPDYYQGTYHASDYVQKNWSKYFEILHIEKPGPIGQYAVLLKA